MAVIHAHMHEQRLQKAAARKAKAEPIERHRKLSNGGSLQCLQDFESICSSLFGIYYGVMLHQHAMLAVIRSPWLCNAAARFMMAFTLSSGGGQPPCTPLTTTVEVGRVGYTVRKTGVPMAAPRSHAAPGFRQYGPRWAAE